MTKENFDATRHLHAALGRVPVGCLDWSTVLVWMLVVLIGWLQSKRIDAGWLTRYGGDVFGTAMFWWMIRRTIFAGFWLGAEIAAASLLVACFAWEFCQRLDLSGSVLGITKGTYDPLDLVAYALTLGFLYAIDRGLQRRQKFRRHFRQECIE